MLGVIIIDIIAFAVMVVASIMLSHLGLWLVERIDAHFSPENRQPNPGSLEGAAHPRS
jgi:hypothetical protein